MLVTAFCEKCFDALEEYGEATQIHYVDVCQQYIHGDIPYYFTDTCYCCDGRAVITKFLEGKDYVISTDWEEDKIFVKPNGTKTLKSGLIVFCPGKCKAGTK